MKTEVQVCTRCVMDTTAEGITFDEAGVCNYCTEFLILKDHSPEFVYVHLVLIRVRATKHFSTPVKGNHVRQQ